MELLCFYRVDRVRAWLIGLALASVSLSAVRDVLVSLCGGDLRAVLGARKSSSLDRCSSLLSAQTPSAVVWRQPHKLRHGLFARLNR